MPKGPKIEIHESTHNLISKFSPKLPTYDSHHLHLCSLECDSLVHRVETH